MEWDNEPVTPAEIRGTLFVINDIGSAVDEMLRILRGDDDEAPEDD